MGLLAVLSMLACGGGAVHSSTVDELRVVAAVVDIPEATTGDAITIDVRIANPEGWDLDLLFWSCAYVDGECIEAKALSTDKWVAVADASSGQVSLSRQVPAVSVLELLSWINRLEEDWGELNKDEYIEIPFFFLVCEAGTCDVIAEAWEALQDPEDTELREALHDKLVDPGAWLADEPIEESSLVTRSFRLSLRDLERRNQNPVFEARFAQAFEETITVDRGTSLEMSFKAADPSGEAVYGYGFTTAGRFLERRDQNDNDDIIRHYYLAPREATTGTVWVVFDDRDGGQAIYEQDVVVR